jgi:parvulin-like peptidyl-prolyl isomerase
MQPVMRKIRILVGLPILIFGLSSCNFPGINPIAATAISPTPTSAPPSPTSVPLAASVNGVEITLEYFEAEVERYQLAQTQAGIDLATIPDYRDQVLQALIDLKLLALGAAQAGHEVSLEEVESRINSIVTASGSQEAFDTWLIENAYTMESLRYALVDEILAAEMVAQIAGDIAQNVEQVHARHILVTTQADAENLRAQISGGEDFGEIAKIYSIDASTRPAGGDLGWFPGGFLLWPEVEQAAFELAPGELSAVIQSELGYHLIEMLERGEHKLDYKARLLLQEQAVQDWLKDQRDTTDIQIFIVP